MDYSKMSDFEINCLVAEATGHSPLDAEHGYAGLQAEGDITAAIVRGPRKIGAFDPCNNPADAWPIITENRIAIIPDSAEGEWVSFNEFTLYEGDWMFASDPAHHSNGKNPLRCAMECFLMMRESANVPTNSTGSDI